MSHWGKTMSVFSAGAGPQARHVPQATGYAGVRNHIASSGEREPGSASRRSGWSATRGSWLRGCCSGRAGLTSAMGAAALSVRCFSCWAGKARAPRVSRRQKSTSTAVLIDGSDLLHHFHGLSSKKDKLAQSGGLCKFAEFVMRLHRDMPVDYFAVAFDCEGQCWRGETWPSYAALRQTAAEKLGPQPRLAAELCKELGVFHERRKGFDAYDLLSTLAADAIMLPHESIVTVVSNQLLAARLVSPRVRLLLPGVGDAALDEDAVV
ncbi:unnamed protein product, partial [Prorocentrum cordatum]